VVDESLLRTSKPTESVVLSYFYQASERTAKAFFASLLKQLLAALVNTRRPCPAKVRNAVEFEFGLENRQPDIGELVADTVVPLMSVFREVFVILDGPDTCEQSEQHELWRQLWRVMESSHSIESGFRLKLAVASQDQTKVTAFLPNTARIRIDDGSNVKDIDTLIDDRIGPLSGTGGLFSDDPLRAEVQRLLKEKADGM
jgi:hypothetical protein